MTTTTTSTKVTTGIVRMSYVHLLEPYAAEQDQDAKYSVTLLIPKDDKKTVDAIKAAIHAAAEAGKDKFGGKVPAHPKTTFRDGDSDDSIDLEEHPEYAGQYFMGVRSNTKPGIVGTQRDADGKLKELDDPEEIYSGMFGRASLNFYAYNSHGNKGISAGLNNVQKTADGERLGGGKSKAEDDFDDWEDDTEDDDLF